MRLAASICICEEDSIYLDQLLPEIDRLNCEVAWLANNCSPETVSRLRHFERTRYLREFNGYFHNCLRNYPFEALERDFDFIIQWDADETWEPKAPEKLRSYLVDQQMVIVRMAHVWEEGEKKYLTTDMGDEKERIYNTRCKWRYLQRVVAGPTNFNEEANPSKLDIWMIHWGYSTPEKRRFHKDRWDRLHGHSVGRNPYGHWRRITDPEYSPEKTPFGAFLAKL